MLYYILINKTYGQYINVIYIKIITRIIMSCGVQTGEIHFHPVKSSESLLKIKLINSNYNH